MQICGSILKIMPVQELIIIKCLQINDLVHDSFFKFYGIFFAFKMSRKMRKNKIHDTEIIGKT
ncbi:hypothetical protein MUO65_03680 [bacterium]|nr:hypothetical protein [bacterium]